MTFEELRTLASVLDTKEVVYLVCAHLEHTGKAEIGFNVNCHEKGRFIGSVRFIPRNKA